MNPVIHELPTPHIVVDDFYDADELKAIWQELEFLRGKLQTPERTGGAREEGRALRKSQAVFLDEVYRDRSTSNILRLNRKLWTAIEPYARTSSFCQIHSATVDHTLIGYYENSDYYDAHADDSLITALTWFYREPRSYIGGDLFLTDFGNYTIEALNNRMVIFPGWVRHEVQPIRMKPDAERGRGRYVMAQLLNYKQQQQQQQQQQR